MKRLQAELDQARLAAEAAKNALLQEHAKDPKYHAEAIQRSLIQRDDEALAEALLAQVAQKRNPKETYAAKTTKWEYDFVVVSDMTQSKFVAFLQDRENRGWDYNGTTTLTTGGNRRRFGSSAGRPRTPRSIRNASANTTRGLPKPRNLRPPPARLSIEFQQRMRDGVAVG